MDKNKDRKVPTNDIPGHSSFLLYHGIEPEFELQGTRVVCLYDANDAFYELSRRFNEGELVDVQRFLKCQRELRLKMLTAKGGR